MGQYSKFDDINALMVRAEKDLSKIEDEYQKSLHAQSIDADLLIDIKNFLGNLRSALDYVNNQIPNADNNFPITDHPNEFANRCLRMDTGVRAVIEKWQPYNSNSWLQWFNILNNKAKHLTLVPQIRKEVIETRVSAPGGSVSWGTGVTFGRGVSIMGVPIDPNLNSTSNRTTNNF